MRIRELSIAVLFVLLLVAALSSASPGESREIGAGYFMGGGGILLGHPSGMAGTLGGGGHGVGKNGLILGGEGHSIFSDEGAGGFGFFDIGYALVRKGNFVGYPILGIGGGSLAQDSDGTVAPVVLINVALGGDYLIAVGTEGGLVVGVRVGYTASVYSSDWHWQLSHARLLLGGYGSKD